MSRFSHLLFVCQKQREPGDPKGCCHGAGSEQLLDRLKALTKEHGLKGKIRITGSGCLDYCSKGAVVFAHSPDSDHPETWYTNLKPGDADRLFERHILELGRLDDRVQTVKPREVP